MKVRGRVNWAGFFCYISIFFGYHRILKPLSYSSHQRRVKRKRIAEAHMPSIRLLVCLYFFATHYSFFAYCFTHCLAFFSNEALSVLYCSAIVVSTASSLPVVSQLAGLLVYTESSPGGRAKGGLTDSAQAATHAPSQVQPKFYSLASTGRSSGSPGTCYPYHRC